MLSIWIIHIVLGVPVKVIVLNIRIWIFEYYDDIYLLDDDDDAFLPLLSTLSVIWIWIFEYYDDSYLLDDDDDAFFPLLSTLSVIWIWIFEYYNIYAWRYLG